MRKLTPQRRLAAIAASLACISAGLPVLLRNSHLPDAVQGLLIGIPIGLAIVLLVLSRRSCSPSNRQDADAN
jgi:hypothetical protein